LLSEFIHRIKYIATLDLSVNRSNLPIATTPHPPKKRHRHVYIYAEEKQSI